MVSTRKLREKFNEGDRVLCYEPDPTKAKVLYDSKVLEVTFNKDEKGRKIIEYLIHFQGWNSSWDRVVSEDFVLKDTDDNRQLQRDLAAKARLLLNSYLYRKDHVDKEDSNLSERTFEAGNSGSGQEEEGTLDDEYLTATDDDNASSVETDDSLDQKVPLELTNTVRLLLENDYDLINRQQKLVKLPASPTVVEILEMYVRYVASRAFRTDADGQRQRMRGQATLQRPASKADELEWVCAKVNLAKETVDGIRISFDYYLGTQLLYNSEQQQYELVTQGILRPFKKEKSPSAAEDVSKSDETPSKKNTGAQALAADTADQERRRSLRSHKDPAAGPEPSSSATTNGLSGPSAKNSGVLTTNSAVNNFESAQSCSSMSSYCGALAGHSAHLAAGPLGSEMNQLHILAQNWTLVPESYLLQIPAPPSAVYGAAHLLRLFVKLPTFIYAANLPEKENQCRYLPEQKLKILLNNLQSFLTFLETKEEWFSPEIYYSYELP